jgi:hypothetical protein
MRAGFATVTGGSPHHGPRLSHGAGPFSRAGSAGCPTGVPKTKLWRDRKFALIGRPPPLRPPISIFPRQPLPQQLYVAAIRAPHHVEGVTDEWNRTDKSIERDIGEYRLGWIGDLAIISAIW